MESPKSEQVDGLTLSEGDKVAMLIDGEVFKADGERIDPVSVKPRVTSFVPRPCTDCQRLRDLDEKIKGKSCSRVYSTQGRTRYCKCGFCGATWKEIE
jgi:hypothetical protein